MGRLTTIHLSLIFGFFNVYHFACVWPTALKLGCTSNFDTLFLVMGFISLVDEIEFMLISSRHICIRSMIKVKRRIENMICVACIKCAEYVVLVPVNYCSESSGGQVTKPTTEMSGAKKIGLSLFALIELD